jgi:hypothetical protein
VSNVVLAPEEIEAITPYCARTKQLNELHRQGFYRARFGWCGVVLERAHHEAVIAGQAHGIAPHLLDLPINVRTQPRVPRRVCQRQLDAWRRSVRKGTPLGRRAVAPLRREPLGRWAAMEAECLKRRRPAFPAPDRAKLIDPFG